MKVRIVSDGTGNNSSVKDLNGNDIPGCFAFEVKGHRMRAVNQATVFCHQVELDVVAEAEVITIPHALRERAKAIVEEMDLPEVAVAFDRLFGFGK